MLVVQWLSPGKCKCTDIKISLYIRWNAAKTQNKIYVLNLCYMNFYFYYIFHIYVICFFMCLSYLYMYINVFYFCYIFLFSNYLICVITIVFSLYVKNCLNAKFLLEEDSFWWFEFFFIWKFLLYDFHRLVVNLCARPCKVCITFSD